MDADLRKTRNIEFRKDFFKVNNVVFRKIMENMRKHRDIKLVKNESKMNRLA